MSHQRKCEACGGFFEYTYSQSLVAAGHEFRCVPCRSKPENDTQLSPPNPMHFSMSGAAVVHRSGGILLDKVDRRHRPTRNFDSLKNDLGRGRKKVI